MILNAFSFRGAALQGRQISVWPPSPALKARGHACANSKRLGSNSPRFWLAQRLPGASRILLPAIRAAQLADCPPKGAAGDPHHSRPMRFLPSRAAWRNDQSAVPRPRHAVQFSRERRPHQLVYCLGPSRSSNSDWRQVRSLLYHVISEGEKKVSGNGYELPQSCVRWKALCEADAPHHAVTGDDHRFPYPLP